jgi:fused signal recognition particle receptor
MSKFFKWLKKDKQQVEPSVVVQVPLQTSSEQVNSEPKIIENDNSTTSPSSPLSNSNVSVTKHNDITQPQQTEIARSFESTTQIPKTSEIAPTKIENNHSTNETILETISETIPETIPENTLENLIEKGKEVVESKSGFETIISQAVIKNDPALENNTFVNNEKKLGTLDKPSIKQQDVGNVGNVGFFSKLKRGLSRTKENIGSGIVSLFRGKAIDDELFEELETQLLVADVGMDTTAKIIQQLTESSDRKQLKDGDALYQLLKQQMADILEKVESPLTLKTESGPFVILMVGVNGVGKTTTIGKMAKQFQQQGKKVMLAAGDTFRAAAVEQLQVWGERNNIPVVAQQTGSDSASVIFDAFQSAKAKNIDVLIADTAGRLQNKEYLMEELKKVVRVIKKIAPEAPHEIMLTLDAATGQNAVSQTKLFNEAVGLTGISLTKLDGTAKGGVIFAIADQFNIPIRYVGIGEGIDDLRPFNSQDFVNALFSEPDRQQ